MEIKGKTVLVLGLARTGSECARFLVNEGANVLVSDRRIEQDCAGDDSLVCRFVIFWVAKSANG
jgi:UDP-N-acetylmuramoylalanine-D-glutamate ligase